MPCLTDHNVQEKKKQRGVLVPAFFSEKISWSRPDVTAAKKVQLN